MKLVISIRFHIEITIEHRSLQIGTVAGGHLTRRFSVFNDHYYTALREKRKDFPGPGNVLPNIRFIFNHLFNYARQDLLNLIAISLGSECIENKVRKVSCYFGGNAKFLYEDDVMQGLFFDRSLIKNHLFWIYPVKP